MAITGNGTKSNPYICYSYDDLAIVCPKTDSYNGFDSSDAVRYVKLGGDIDCNKYDVDFEWHSIELGGGSSDGTTVELDLNGHTIKNVMIATDNYMFISNHYNGKSSRIVNSNNEKKGGMFNIFLNSAKGVIGSPLNNTQGTTCTMIGVSMSINANSRTDYAFKRIAMENCSMYYVEYAPVKSVVFNYNSITDFKNCDFYFDITDTYAASDNKTIEIFYNQQSSSSTIGMDSCRLCGYINDITTSSSGKGQILWGLYPSRKATNVVVDIHTRHYYPNYTGASMFYADASGIYNSEHIVASYTSKITTIAVTTEEMKSATKLVAKGFNVAEISG